MPDSSTHPHELGPGLLAGGGHLCLEQLPHPGQVTGRSEILVATVSWGFFSLSISKKKVLQVLR